MDLAKAGFGLKDPPAKAGGNLNETDSLCATVVNLFAKACTYVRAIAKFKEGVSPLLTRGLVHWSESAFRKPRDLREKSYEIIEKSYEKVSKSDDRRVKCMI